MQKKWAIGFAVLGFMMVASPVIAQDILIGPAGVRVQEQVRDRRGPPRDDRRDRREISEREAVRIAKGEGVRDVDDVERTRRSFRIVGIDRRGRDIQVDVDRRTGDVLDVR